MSKNTNKTLAANAESTDNGLSETEFRYLLQLSKEGDLEARNRILLANMGLIYKIANEVNIPNASKEDLINEGCARFLEIINNYDPDKGALSTYMWQPLLQAMKHGTPGYSSKTCIFVKEYNETIDYLSDKLRREPTEEEVCQEMGLSKIQLKHRLQSVFNQNLLRLDAPCDPNDADSPTLKDSELCATEHDASWETIRKDECNCINKAWSRLDEEERFMLQLRVTENGKKISLKKAAEITGLCKATVSKREDSAREHFREILEEYGIIA